LPPAAIPSYLITVKPHAQKIRDLVASLLEWFPRSARDLPWRRTSDPYAIFVSEIMLQQTQVRTVIPYWERWMNVFPNSASLAGAEIERVLKLWEGLGYYSRARNLQRAAQLIQSRHDGQFPKTHEEVSNLPGIGPYTAGAICSIAFNQPTPILDGNVIRVLCRIFGIGQDPAKTTTRRRLWSLARELVETASQTRLAYSCSTLNQSLMELGALICTPKGPSCERCPVEKYCVARKTSRVLRLPALAKREKQTARRFAAFVAQRGDQFLVRQRPDNVVNAGFWEFPNVEQEFDASLTSPAGLTLRKSAVPFLVIRHTITRYQITLEVYEADSNGHDPQSDGEWRDLESLAALPFSAAHKKILERLADLFVDRHAAIKPPGHRRTV
jgi:A/G-specific adenine glycosylase